MTDRVLLKRYAGQRDAQAFADLVRGYQRLVFATCRRVLYCAADVDDAVQETFLRLAQKAGQIESNLGAWLHRCAVNVSMDLNRRREARRRHEAEAAMPADAASESQGELAELREHVDAAIEKLTEEQRELIIQRFFVGRSQGDLAREFGVTASAMTYRVDKAVEALRSELQELGCIAGIGVVSAMMEVEQVASVPQVLTENLMKIGLKGVGASRAGVLGPASVRMAAIAAGVVVVVILGVWWLGWGRTAAAGPTGVVPLAQVAVPVKPVPAKPAPVAASERFLDFQAVDAATGKGIADAALTIELATEMKQESYRSSSAVTDAEGKRRIVLPDQDLVMLRIRVRKDGLVPMRITWANTELRGGMASSYVLKMEKGTSIGGIVQNGQGKGVAGASVSLIVPGSERGSDYPRADIWDYTVVSDAEGKWRCDIMPSKLDEVMVKLSHPGYQSDTTYGASGTPSVEELRKLSVVMVLKKGMSVAGKAVDGGGHPIAGVTIRQGESRWGTSEPTTQTNAAGEFRFANAKMGKMTLTAQVRGYMPEMQEVEVRPGMAAVEFRMRPGAGFDGQVVDAGGNPIAGATVVADTWRGNRTIEWSGTTDAQGRFTWEDAPADEVRYHILKGGYVSNRSATGTSSAEMTRFVLLPQTKIHGRVIDAESGKPVAAFRAVLGSRSGSGWYWNERRSRTLADGWYEAVASEAGEEYAVRIEAEGYLPVVTEGVKAGTADAVRDVKLQRGSGPSGVVRTPDGKPVAGARYALASAGGRVDVINGKMEVRRWNVRSKPEELLTDGEGRYALPPLSEEATLVVINDLGIAVTPLKPGAAPADVTLRPWARMEGTLRYGKNVLPNATISAGAVSWSGDKSSVSASATSDAQGHFILDHLPPTRVEIYRYGKHVGNRSEMKWLAQLDPQPGETISRDLGGEGARVIGRTEVPSAFAGKPVYASMPPKQQRMEHPENWDLMSPEERRQWAAAHPNAARHDVTGVFVGEDGSFELADLRAGTFTLLLSASENNQPVAEYRQELTIAKGTPDGVTDLGTVKLEAARRLEVGKPALPLQLTTMDGKRLTLDELRGKWTFVTTDATWTASQPGRRRPEEVAAAVLGRCGGEEKMQVVTLLFDERLVWVQRYLTQHPIPGLLVYAGEESGVKADDLAPYSSGWGVLIDPEGVVRAVSLMQGPDVPGAVAKAMQK